MATIEKSIDVEVPVSAAYDQWTQFEEFPKFMEGIVAVRQLDDSHIRWVAEIAGERQEWDAEIVEQQPDCIIAWRSTDGLVNRGRVEFVPIATGTRVNVEMECQPEGIKETVGAGVVRSSRATSSRTIPVADRREASDLVPRTVQAAIA